MTKTMTKKISCLLIMLAACCAGALAQPGELSYSKGVWHNGTKIKSARVKTLMADNSEALKQYKSGRALALTGEIITACNSVIILADLGVRANRGNSEGNNTLLGVGVAGGLVGLVLWFSGERKIKNSVLLYNANASNGALSSQLHLGITQAGIGLSLRF
jgi:hypothetical protein